ncbi:MAG: hypothetical protein C4547_01635, partial [Phycisphaerales bacterium]
PSLTVGVRIDRVKDGYMVVNQDANWNVVSATDLAGRVLERTFYTAYGLPTFNSQTYFGDYDGDGDSTDDGHLGSGETAWGAGPYGACRVFDFDQDADADTDDQTILTSRVSLASTSHSFVPLGETGLVRVDTHHVAVSDSWPRRGRKVRAALRPPAHRQRVLARGDRARRLTTDDQRPRPAPCPRRRAGHYCPMSRSPAPQFCPRDLRAGSRRP